MELMKQCRASPTDNLWIANCVLYSVVTAFVFHKGWKKNKGQIVRQFTREKDQSGK